MPRVSLPWPGLAWPGAVCPWQGCRELGPAGLFGAAAQRATCSLWLSAPFSQCLAPVSPLPRPLWVPLPGQKRLHLSGQQTLAPSLKGPAGLAGDSPRAGDWPSQAQQPELEAAPRKHPGDGWSSGNTKRGSPGQDEDQRVHAAHGPDPDPSQAAGRGGGGRGQRRGGGHCGHRGEPSSEGCMARSLPGARLAGAGSQRVGDRGQGKRGRAGPRCSPTGKMCPKAGLPPDPRSGLQTRQGAKGSGPAGTGNTVSRRRMRSRDKSDMELTSPVSSCCNATLDPLRGPVQARPLPPPIAPRHQRAQLHPWPAQGPPGRPGALGTAWTLPGRSPRAPQLPGGLHRLLQQVPGSRPRGTGPDPSALVTRGALPTHDAASSLVTPSHS